jgi:hypothetical protein
MTRKGSKKSFWLEAIPKVKEQFPEFIFMAEVYWDREWDLQQQGFNFTYDKRLYDRLLDDNISLVRSHLCADLEFQERSVRFLENHDEPRASNEFPDINKHKAAAIISFFVPGMRFFHEGQLDGRKLKVSVHVGRRQKEGMDPQIAEFYQRLLEALRLEVFRKGEWKLLNCKEAWEGNSTDKNFLAFLWSTPEQAILITVNYASYKGQCYVDMSDLTRFSWLYDRDSITFVDIMRDGLSFERNAEEIVQSGLFLDEEGYNYHIYLIK